MWYTKCFVTPVITGARIIVTKGLTKYLESIPRKYSVDSLIIIIILKKRTAVLGTSQIIRKVLQSET
jgi:hypothetical protein